MITEKQKQKIEELIAEQARLDRMNQYYLLVEVDELTYQQAREVILVLKCRTETPIDFDDLDINIYNEVGVIAG